MYLASGTGLSSHSLRIEEFLLAGRTKMAHNTTGWFFFQAQLNSPFLFQSFSHYKIHNVNQFDSCSFFSFNYWFFVDLFTIHNIAFRFFINFSRVFIALIHFSSDCFQRYRKQKSSFGRIPSYFFFSFLRICVLPFSTCPPPSRQLPKEGFLHSKFLSWLQQEARCLCSGVQNSLSIDIAPLALSQSQEITEFSYTFFL